MADQTYTDETQIYIRFASNTSPISDLQLILHKLQANIYNERNSAKMELIVFGPKGRPSLADFKAPDVLALTWNH